MSASQFFAHRDALLASSSVALSGLVSYAEINDKITALHPDNLFAVICTYDNGCPEDYNCQTVGLFRFHDDATLVLEKLNRKDHGEYVSYHIERVRVY